MLLQLAYYSKKSSFEILHKGHKADKILRHAERALLNERIRQNNQKIGHLTSKQEDLRG